MWRHVLTIGVSFGTMAASGVIRRFACAGAARAALLVGRGRLLVEPGALPDSVLRMVLRQGSLPAVSGVVLGVLGSFLAGRFIPSVFPNTAADAVTYLLIVPSVVVVVMLAAYIPARRAAYINPLLALRQD